MVESPTTLPAKSGGNSADPVEERDLSELLRAMTTTTTIETTSTSTATSLNITPSVPSPDPPSQFAPTQAGQFSTNSSATTSTTTRPLEASLPTTINRSYKIFGVPTHTFCQVFSDRIVVGVTQLQTKERNNQFSKKSSISCKDPISSPSSSGHIGSWVYCQASKSEIDPRQVEYELSTLLGSGASRSDTEAGNRDEKEIYARRIAERLLEKRSIPGGTNKIVLLLGISLLPMRKADNNGGPSSSLSSPAPEAPAAPTSFSSIDRFKAVVEVLVELIEQAVGIALQRS